MLLVAAISIAGLAVAFFALAAAYAKFCDRVR